MMAKKTMMVFVAALLSLGASAAVQLVSPQTGATVPLLSVVRDTEARAATRAAWSLLGILSFMMVA